MNATQISEFLINLHTNIAVGFCDSESESNDLYNVIRNMSERELNIALPSRELNVNAPEFIPGAAALEPSTPDAFVKMWSESEESDDASMKEVNPMCAHVYTKGPRKGQHCEVVPRKGEFCGKHRVKTEESADASSEECAHIFTKGPHFGEKCTVHPKYGDRCSKHRLKFTSEEIRAVFSCDRKLVDLKALAESSGVNTHGIRSKKALLDAFIKHIAAPKFIRNKELQVWVVEDDNLVVKSPQNPQVYAYVTKKGTLHEGVPKRMQEKVQQLGLAC